MPAPSVLHRLVDVERLKRRRIPTWLILLVGAAILFARKPDAFRTPQFWAEDGWFYWWAVVDGWRALISPYAGYLHTFPRILAAVAAHLDPLWAPRIFVGAAFAATLYVAARACSDRCQLPLRAGCALAVVLVPDAFEVLLNIVNVQSLLSAGLILLLISREPERRSQHVHDYVVAVLFGLTGPFSLLLAPLFIWRAFARRTGSSILLAGIIAACGALQFYHLLHDPANVKAGPIDLGAGLAVPGMRIAASLLAGWWVPLDYWRPVEVGLTVLTLATVALLAVRRGGARLERIWLATAFVLLLVSSVFRVRHNLPDLCHSGFGSRYFYTPQLLVIWLLLGAAMDQRRWIKWSAGAVIFWALAVNGPRLRENPLTDYHWADVARKLRAGEETDVHVNPDWTIHFPARSK